jgi:hypothetical protein
VSGWAVTRLPPSRRCRLGVSGGVADPRGGYASGNAQTSRPSSVNVVCSLTLIIRSPSSGNRGREAKSLIADPSDRWEVWIELHHFVFVTQPFVGCGQPFETQEG